MEDVVSVMMANDDFVLKLAKALGLPKNTRSFEIRFAVGEAVIVKCEYLPDDPKDACDAQLWRLATYQLVKKDEVLTDELADPQS